MNYQAKANLIIGIGSVCASLIAGVVDYKQAVKEQKRLADKKYAEAELARLRDLDFEKTNELMLDLLKGTITFEQKKKAEIDRQKVNKLFMKKPKNKREISIAKVREIIDTYGITMEDFRRDFPEAIIVD